MTGKTTLLLGGARSGKSRLAEQLTAKTGLQKIYLATSEIRDTEMRLRVDQHIADRGPDWHTIEEPVNIADILRLESKPERVILVDCLTLWLSNVMEREIAVEEAMADLQSALDDVSGPVILVSNEVGMGIVPMNKLARQFRDLAGRLHQSVAATCDDVALVVAGLPLVLKKDGIETGNSLLR